MPPASSPSMVLKLSPRAKELSAFLQTLPVVQHAFAYGSGIFTQKGLYESGGKGKGPMLDFIFAVEDPTRWHEKVGICRFTGPNTFALNSTVRNG